MNSENFRKGFLIDAECMAGITELAPTPEKPAVYAAFVLLHESGEYASYQEFAELDQALAAINSVRRDWIFESTSGCGNGACKNNESGACAIGGCGGKNC